MRCNQISISWVSNRSVLAYAVQTTRWVFGMFGKRPFLDLMCSPKLLQGCRLRHPRTSTRLGWRFWIDWILFILFTSHLRWSPLPLLHSWQPTRPASVSDKDGEISRARLSEVKSDGEESRWGKVAVHFHCGCTDLFYLPRDGFFFFPVAELQWLIQSF